MKHLSSCHSPFFCIVREKTAISVKHSEKNLSSDSFFSLLPHKRDGSML